MSRLFDPLPSEAKALTEVIIGGYTRGRDQWPVWQYVQHQMDAEHGLSAATVLQDLPTWRYSYRPVCTPRGLGIPPEIDDPVQLTVQGLANVDNSPAAQGLLRAFMAATALGLAAQRAAEPGPTRVVPVVLDSESLTVGVNMRAGTSLAAPQLYSLLQREPTTWGALNGSRERWTWDLSSRPLRLFDGVETVDQLLTAFEEVLGTTPEHRAQSSALPAEAVPEALDHLNLAWRLRMGSPLLQLRTATTVASLSAGANSAEDFAARCTALADVISQFNVPPHDADPSAASLRRLRLHLDDWLGAQHPALDAVGTLQNVVAVRNTAGHPSSAHRHERQHIALGLHHLRGDWSASWEQVRVHTVLAARTIREALLSLGSV